MINSLPPIQVPQVPNVQVQQHDPSLLLREDLQDIVRSVILKYAIQRQINQNDAEQILSSVSIQDLKTHKYIVQHNDSTEHFAASVNKLPVTMLTLEELRKGTITFDTVLTWQVSDRRAGGGVYDQDGSPLQATVKEVMFDLLNRSGNTAVRALVNKVLGGATAVNTRLAQVPQLAHTRLIPLDADRFYLGNTTSREALWVLEKVLSRQDVYGKYVKHALETNIYTDYGVQSNPRSDYIVLANKLGQLDDLDGNNRHDVGIIYNTRTKRSFGYSFLTTSPNARTTATIRAEQSLKNMGGLVLRYAGNRVNPQQPESATLRSLAAPANDGKILY